MYYYVYILSYGYHQFLLFVPYVVPDSRHDKHINVNSFDSIKYPLAAN